MRTAHPGLAMALALAAALPAGAEELAKAGDFKLEGSGFLKPALNLLWLQPSLVTGFRLPELAALSSATLRLDLKALYADALELEVAWQPAAVVASDARFLVSSSTSYLGAALVAPTRRLDDFPPVLEQAGGVALLHNLDRLAVTWRTARTTLVVGRQVISWGTGHLWNPTDLMSPFAPTDLDREVRRGADAVRLSIGLSETAQLDLLWLPQQAAADNGGVVRVRGNLLGWDLSATVAKYVRDLVLGADFSGEAGPLGLHGEAAWTLPLTGLDGPGPLGVRDDFVRAVVGLDWRPVEKLILGLEYYFNSFGAKSPAGLLTKLQDARVVRGEVFGAGRHYLGLTASVLATELLTANLTALLNVTDPSALLLPSLEWAFAQNGLLRLGVYLPLGAQARVVDAATLKVESTSEYGLSSYGVFLQVGVYVN